MSQKVTVKQLKRFVAASAAWKLEIQPSIPWLGALAHLCLSVYGYTFMFCTHMRIDCLLLEAYGSVYEKYVRTLLHHPFLRVFLIGHCRIFENGFPWLRMWQYRLNNNNEDLYSAFLMICSESFTETIYRGYLEKQLKRLFYDFSEKIKLMIWYYISYRRCQHLNMQVREDEVRSCSV